MAKAAEIVTERWTPLVIRELLMGSRRFNDLRRGVPLMSPSLLSDRLKALERAGIVRRERDGGHAEYHLTEAGEELRPIVEMLGVWGQRWVRTPMGDGDLDASLLMWDIRRRVRTQRIERGRVVVHFAFPSAPKGQKHWWLVLEPEESDLCLNDPGFGVDLEVETDVRTMTMVWMGDLTFDEVLRTGSLSVDGPPDLRGRLPDWLELSSFAGVERPAPAGG